MGLQSKVLTTSLAARGFARFASSRDSEEDAVLGDNGEKEDIADDNDMQAVRFDMNVMRLMANFKKPETLSSLKDDLKDEEMLQRRAQEELKMVMRHMDYIPSFEEGPALAEEVDEEREGEGGSVRTKKQKVWRGNVDEVADDFRSLVAASPNATAYFSDGAFAGSGRDVFLPDAAESARKRLLAALEVGPPTHDGPTCEVCKHPASMEEIAEFGKCSFCRGKELQDGSPSVARRRSDVHEGGQQESKADLAVVVEMSKLAEQDIFLFLAAKCRALLPEESIDDLFGEEVEVGKFIFRSLIEDRHRSREDMRQIVLRIEKLEDRLSGLMEHFERMEGVLWRESASTSPKNEDGPTSLKIEDGPILF